MRIILSLIKREGRKMDLSVKEIERAAERIAPSIHRTKLERSKTFSEMSGAEVYFKFENQQKTGSFKIRGASNKIAAMIERGEIKAAVASSAGNHAQGVAYAAHINNIPSNVILLFMTLSINYHIVQILLYHTKRTLSLFTIQISNFISEEYLLRTVLFLD